MCGQWKYAEARSLSPALGTTVRTSRSCITAGPCNSSSCDDLRVGLLVAVDDVDLGDDGVGQGFLVVHFDEAEDVGLTEAGMHQADPRDRLQGFDDVFGLSRFDLDQDVGFGCHGASLQPSPAYSLLPSMSSIKGLFLS